jgi:hypothetical protein
MFPEDGSRRAAGAAGHSVGESFNAAEPTPQPAKAQELAPPDEGWPDLPACLGRAAS